MKTIPGISKLLISAAVFLFSIAAVILVLKQGPEKLYAVDHVKGGAKVSDYIFSQSSDGKAIYQWTYDRKSNKWKRTTHSASWK